eukprot:TRINITY_DN8705_c0_g1_i6.p1 TRINITY_DN8705_c0_g1~~TRINITY_DN8705_c0_g1_i6.p1  ORF type:complete len:179 (+),score=23.05 TRINITY_DN8705_c0_g1_i6:338-874(+)
MPLLGFVGRCMFASLFLMSGAMKLQQFDINDGGAQMEVVSQKLDTAITMMKDKLPDMPVSLADVQPFYPRLLLAAIVLELSGGALFVLGSSFGAYMLILFTAPVTAIMHDFWNEEDDDKKKVEMVQFMKNVVIVGALLFFLSMRSQLSTRKRALAQGKIWPASTAFVCAQASDESSRL